MYIYDDCPKWTKSNLRWCLAYFHIIVHIMCIILHFCVWSCTCVCICILLYLRIIKIYISHGLNLLYILVGFANHRALGRSFVFFPLSPPFLFSSLVVVSSSEMWQFSISHIKMSILTYRKMKTTHVFSVGGEQFSWKGEWGSWGIPTGFFGLCFR